MESSSWPWLHLYTLASVIRQTNNATLDWVLVLVLLVALFLAASASAAETALTSVSRIKIRNQAEEGDLRAQRIRKMLETPQNFLSTILVVSNVSVIVATTVSTILAINLFVNYGEIISTIILSFVVLVFCEITPKTIAVQAPETWAKRVAGPVDGLSKVLHPIIVGLTFITTGLVRLIGGGAVRRGPFVTEEELRLLVEVGEEEGVLEEDEREMIHNVFELADTTVREIMVPRIDMVTIEGSASVDEAMDLIVQGGQSRIPVYDTSIDNIMGVLYAKDLLRIIRTNQHPQHVREIVRPAYFVPESKHLDDLLRELQQQHVHIAIVIDEYGSVSGLVTIEDLVEEIIGDIQDEYDREEQLLERISDDEYLVNAKISLDELNEELGSNLTSQDYDTLGGYVYAHLDKIPTVGDVVEGGGFTMTVMSTRGRRVTKVRLVRQRPQQVRPDDHESSSGATPSPPNSPVDSAAISPAVSSPAQNGAEPHYSPPPQASAYNFEAAEETASRPLRVRTASGRRNQNHSSPQARRRS